MTLAAKVTRALERQNLPIVGVSIGRADDRSTWRVDYASSATDAQKTAGAALVATYDEATDAEATDEEANSGIDGNKLLKAIVVWAAQRFGITPAQARTQIIAVYKQLP